MTIQGVNTNIANQSIVKKENNKVENKETRSKEEFAIQDKYEKSEVENKKVIYKKPEPKRDEATIERVKSEVDQIHNNLKELVRKLLEKQGMTFKDLDIDGEDIEIDEETRLEAQKAINEGGELSIESVSDRLVDFAKAITGGNKEKIGLMRDAINKGFEEAEKAFGGKLPEISYKTLERAMEKLDDWANAE